MTFMLHHEIIALRKTVRHSVVMAIAQTLNDQIGEKLNTAPPSLAVDLRVELTNLHNILTRIEQDQDEVLEVSIGPKGLMVRDMRVQCFI